MTLDEAIRTMDESFKDPWLRPKGKFGDAIQLGIEALKRLKQYREFHRSSADDPLPGETEE